MSLKPSSYKKSDSGFSLVAVLVAAALVGVLSVVIGNMISGGQKGQLALQQKDEFQKLLDYTKLVLATRENCGLDLPNLQSETFLWSEISSTSPKKIVLSKIGSNNEISVAYPMNGLVLNEMILEIKNRIGTENKVDARILLSSNKTINTPGGRVLSDSGLPVVLTTVGGAETAPQYVTGCFAMVSNVASEMDLEAMCDLLGRAYDEDSGQCIEPASEVETDATEMLFGDEALKANQAVQSCVVESDSGKPKELACNPYASEHRTRKVSGSADIPELYENEKVVTTNGGRRYTGSCYIENGQWYRGTLFVPKGSSASTASTSSCPSTLSSATQACYMSNNLDRKRRTCDSVKVANLQPAPAIQVIGEYNSTTKTAAAPDEFKIAPTDYRKAFGDSEIHQMAQKIESCYLGGGDGAPPTKERECYQTVNTKISGGVEVFKSYPSKFCMFNTDKQVWRYYSSQAWSTCKGGVKLNSGTSLQAPEN